jgi:hypothetical protein
MFGCDAQPLVILCFSAESSPCRPMDHGVGLDVEELSSKQGGAFPPFACCNSLGILSFDSILLVAGYQW